MSHLNKLKLTAHQIFMSGHALEFCIYCRWMIYFIYLCKAKTAFETSDQGKSCKAGRGQAHGLRLGKLSSARFNFLQAW